FSFQAEDGIRDFHVTGVQTCALPIYLDEVDYRVDCTLIVVRDLRIADNDVPLDHSVSSCDSHSLSSPQNTSNPQMRHGATDHRLFNLLHRCHENSAEIRSLNDLVSKLFVRVEPGHLIRDTLSQSRGISG